MTISVAQLLVGTRGRTRNSLGGAIGARGFAPCSQEHIPPLVRNVVLSADSSVVHPLPSLPLQRDFMPLSRRPSCEQTCTREVAVASVPFWAPAEGLRGLWLPQWHDLASGVATALRPPFPLSRSPLFLSFV